MLRVLGADLFRRGVHSAEPIDSIPDWASTSQWMVELDQGGVVHVRLQFRLALRCTGHKMTASVLVKAP